MLVLLLDYGLILHNSRKHLIKSSNKIERWNYKTKKWGVNLNHPSVRKCPSLKDKMVILVAGICNQEWLEDLIASI